MKIIDYNKILLTEINREELVKIMIFFVKYMHNLEGLDNFKLNSANMPKRSCMN